MTDHRTSASKDARTPGGANAAAGEPYYASARSWAVDRQDSLMASRRTAWLVATAAAGVAVLEALALVALAPLKTVVPYTVLVDRTTGYAEVLEGGRTPSISPDAAVTQSLLAQYVLARETYDINSLAEQYRKVALWSAEGARADYLATMPAGNPASPINRYPRSTVVTARIESLSQIAPQTVMVRFVTERRDANQSRGRPVYWSSVVKYRFSGQPMSLDDRLVNPLGFQVVGYRRDQESPPLSDPAAPAVAAAASGPVGPQGADPALASGSRPSPGNNR